MAVSGPSIIDRHAQNPRSDTGKLAAQLGCLDARLTNKEAISLIAFRPINSKQQNMRVYGSHFLKILGLLKTFAADPISISCNVAC